MLLRGWARYGLPGVVLGLMLAWCLDGRGPMTQAQAFGQGAATQPQAGGVERSRLGVSAQAEALGTIAFSSSLGGSAQLLYVIDTKTHAMAVYRVDPANPKGTLKLEAARQYQYDLKLDEYNNQEPSVAVIESTVKSLGGPSRK